MYASRNLSVCTKDCLCLFVCPTGATDTETGQIDSSRCQDGCRLCVDACPSHAIYLVMENYPEPDPKEGSAAEGLMELAGRLCVRESEVRRIGSDAADPGARKLAAALQRSCRILAEDCTREAGYMLPQSRPVRELLEHLSRDESADVKDAAGRLLELLFPVP